MFALSELTDLLTASAGFELFGLLYVQLVFTKTPWPPPIYIFKIFKKLEILKHMICNGLICPKICFCV